VVAAPLAVAPLAAAPLATANNNHPVAHVHNWFLVGVGNYRCACGAYMDDH
jgi:hypothetical protein